MFQSEMIRTKDGENVAAKIYKPKAEASKVVVIAPSAEVVQDYYYDLAVYLMKHNIAVITFDFRGTGISAPKELKGFKANLENWAQLDLDAVLRHAKNLFPRHEIVFIGHGIGGEIIGLSAGSQFISRIVLVSSGLSCSRLRRWKEKLWIGAMKKFVKVTTWMVGYFPGKGLRLLKNMPKGVIDEWIEWCDNENGLFDDFPDYNYAKLQVPLLAFSFSDDWRSQESGVRALLHHFSAACIQWYAIRPRQLGVRRVGHSGFFKAQFEKKLWHVLLAWIDEKDNNCVPVMDCKQSL